MKSEPMIITELPMRFDESESDKTGSASKSQGVPISALRRTAHARSSGVDDVIFVKSRPASFKSDA